MYVNACTCILVFDLCTCTSMLVHDVIGDVERKKERKKERHVRQWKNENESCLRWDSNPRHVFLCLIYMYVHVHEHLYMYINACTCILVFDLHVHKCLYI